LAAVPDVGRATRVESKVAPEATATQDLYERYSAQLLGYCFHKLGNREEAEDAVQQTFLNAFRGLKRGIVPEAESAWLFKIAENVCLTRRRSSFRRGRVETPGDIQALQEYVAAPQRMGTDELIQLQKALVGMPATQRKAILLREWQGLSYREIADEMGLSQPAVETLIFRARRSLAEGLERPEERSTLLARLRSGFDLAPIAGGLKALLAGSVAAKAVATTAAAVTVAAAVVAAAPEQRGQEAPKAPLERASAAATSAPGATVSATARTRADALRTAAATRRDTAGARASRPEATPASTATDSAAGSAAAAAAVVEHPAPPDPAHPDPVTPASPPASGAPEHAGGLAAGTSRAQAKGRGKPAADEPAQAAASGAAPEKAKTNAPDARPEPPDQPAPPATPSAPELPAAAEAGPPEQSEAKAENANAQAQPEAPAQAKGKP
jgi:RNA polymerase sigma factor (sigma-70 family)